jgi:signal transduction histidine kinase
MSITDNGKGFSPESKNMGFGLQSMQERAQRVGGQLTIESNANQGTSICLRISQEEFSS